MRKLSLDVAVKAMEHVMDNYTKLTLQQKIDLGARVRSLRARAEAVDSWIRDDINKKLHNKDGVVRGVAFSAERATHPVTRVDQQYLEVNHPRVYNKCLKTTNEARILFQAR